MSDSSSEASLAPSFLFTLITQLKFTNEEIQDAKVDRDLARLHVKVDKK